MLTIALAGNPNTGKSTIFNALTGSRQRVGNWPGKTIEQKSGHLTHRGVEITIVDLPGTYSLSAYSPEEQIARDYIIKNHPTGVVNVVDAVNLERNLYLTTQIVETGIPLMIVLNMIDQAQGRGYTINLSKLSAALNGVPVVATAASQGVGLSDLKDSLLAFAQKFAGRTPHVNPNLSPPQPHCHV